MHKLFICTKDFKHVFIPNWENTAKYGYQKGGGGEGLKQKAADPVDIKTVRWKNTNRICITDIFDPPHPAHRPFHIFQKQEHGCWFFCSCGGSKPKNIYKIDNIAFIQSLWYFRPSFLRVGVRTLPFPSIYPLPIELRRPLYPLPSKI
jgi:hypothetical protein